MLNNGNDCDIGFSMEMEMTNDCVNSVENGNDYEFSNFRI